MAEEQQPQKLGPVLDSYDTDAQIEAEIEQQIEQELQAEQKYGDRPIEAGALEAASAATFGLSDQALVKSKLYTPEELKEVRERSPIASGLGMATGIIAPAIASGGSSIAAKAASAPITAAAKIGTITEKASAKALDKLLADTGRKKIAKEIVKKSLGTAAEGAAFGLGESVKEDALGTADFNAENVIANLGAGALLGAGVGGGVGALKATMPTVAKGANSLTQTVKSKFSKLSDPKEAAKELVGFTDKQVRYIEKNNPKLFDELPDFFRTKLDLRTLDTAESLATKVDEIKASTGEKIGNLVKEIDDLSASESQLLPLKSDVYSSIANQLDEEFIQKYKNVPGFKDQIKPVKAIQKEFRELAKSTEPIRVAELQGLRQKMDELAFKTKSEITTYKAQAARSARNILRKSIDDIADKLSVSTANPAQRSYLTELKALNKDYSIASEILEPLAKRGRKTSFLSFPDIVETAAGYAVGQEVGLLALGARRVLRSDIRRNLAILADVQKANTAVEGRIKSGINGFFKKPAKAVKPLSLKVLTSSVLSKNPESGNEAKNKKEAFKNVSANINKLVDNPEQLLNSLVKSSYRVGLAAPSTAQAMQNTLTNAVNFLHSKAPRSILGPSSLLFKKSYQPSSLELAKFERYMQIIEAPLSALDELEDGTLTREHVEALKAVYPDIYKRVQAQVLEEVDLHSDLSYNKKVQLGVLLDIPTDESLEPYAIQRLQSTFSEDNSPEASEGAVNTTVGGAENINIAEREMTPTQQVQARGQT